MSLCINLLQMSLSASFAVFYLLLLRVLLRRFPKKDTYALWGLIAFHMISPVKPTARVAVLPRLNIEEGLRSMDIPWKLLMAIYCIGALIIVTVNILQYFRLSRMLKKASKEPDVVDGIKIYRCADLTSAFTCGFIKPRIYIPKGLDEDVERVIIMHEKTHIHRLDYWVKSVGFILYIINWFNPFIWIAFYYFVRDQEASCDEIVLQGIGAENKKEYAGIILKAATGFFTSGDKEHAIAFGEANIKYRIRHCVEFKTFSRKRNALALIICCALGVAGIFVSDKFAIEYKAAENNDMAIENPGKFLIGVYKQGDGFRYEKRTDGVYYVNGSEEMRLITEVYVDSSNFDIYDNGIFTVADNESAIYRIDTGDNEVEKVFENTDGKKIKNFIFRGEVMYVTYQDNTGESVKLPGNNIVIDTKDILENRGTVYDISHWDDDAVYADVDVDSDGINESIKLDYSLSDVHKTGETQMIFSVGDKSYRRTVNDISNNIYAVSFDGETVTFLLEYKIEDIESGKELWNVGLYRVNNGEIELCGEIASVLSSIQFEKDCITVSATKNIIQNEIITYKYSVDENSKLTLLPEKYMPVSNAFYNIISEIKVHKQPESEEVSTIVPQAVQAKSITGLCDYIVDSKTYTGYWVELEGTDDTGGWIFVCDGMLPEAGMETKYLFAPGSRTGPIITQNANMIQEKQSN